MDNLEGMDEFLEKYNIPKLNQEEMDKFLEKYNFQNWTRKK